MQHKLVKSELNCAAGFVLCRCIAAEFGRHKD